MNNSQDAPAVQAMLNGIKGRLSSSAPEVNVESENNTSYVVPPKGNGRGGWSSHPRRIGRLPGVRPTGWVSNEADWTGWSS